MTKTSVAAPIKHVYVPEGTQNLFDDLPASVQAKALEILALITAKPGVQCNTHGTGGAFEGAQKRYGRTGKRGEQQWVWYVVIDRLKSLGVVEVIEPAICGVQSKSYALTLEYVARPLVRVPDDSALKPVPQRETAKPIPRWAAACLAAATFDMAGAVRCRLSSLGIPEETATPLSASLDFNAIRDTIRAHAESLVPADERDDIVTIKRGKRSVKLTRAKHAGNAAAARFTSEFKPLWRWRVDAMDIDDEDTDARAWRDWSGFRLHSPITQIDSDLRPFLGFGGLDPADSGLVQIDAVNAQAVFLAALIVAEQPDSDDARRFLDTCGRGRFYEETFAALYGREPSRSTEPDKRVKYRKPRKTPDPETGRMYSIRWGSERDAWKRRMMGAWLYAHAATQQVTAEGIAIGGLPYDADPEDEDDDGGEVVSGLWPDVHAYMLRRKLSWKRDEDGVLRPGGARELPIAMQRAESALWIDAIVPALERAGVPVWTIHDSAIVPADRADEALAVIEAAYSDAGYIARFGEPERIR